MACQKYSKLSKKLCPSANVGGLFLRSGIYGKKSKFIEGGYDENFYKHQREISHRYASVIIPVVAKFVHPHSIIDIGCGEGGWLDYWQKVFGVEIYGVDGDYVDRNWLFIDKKFFHPLNLEERINFGKRFDLVQSMEVAEHLSPARADSFVEDLTKLGDVILFSAAVPTTGGVHHVNEQWQSYWANLFQKFGYVGIDCIRPKIWSDARLSVNRRQNCFIYVKSTELYRYPELQKYYLEHSQNTVYDMIHPQFFVDRINKFQNIFQQFQAYLAQIKQKK
ncbi:MAG: methyltransferase domain-containing protein [Selenomonadaceae bacterium]|nr:methyltransferase domain-containing protein [Selenomonadaceae bacterium]